MNGSSWKSEAFNLNDDTCVDVQADVHGVVIGQQGAAWMHNLHVSPDAADGLGEALKTGAAFARNAQQAQS